MSTTRLAIVRQKYNATGGAERFVTRAIEALSSDIEVTLIARKWNSHAGQSTLKIDPFYIGSVWRDWGFARAVRRAVASSGFDLVQSHERIPGLSLYRAGDGVHAEWLIQRERAQSPIKRIGRWLNPYHHYMLVAERRMFEHPDLRAVICISDLVRRDILRHFAIDPTKLHVIYNGIDSEAWHPRLRSTLRAQTRAVLGIAEDIPLMLFVGSGYERKGVDTLLRALSLSPATTQLIVIGKDKHELRYKQLAQSLGLADRVKFMGAQEEVRRFYACADAFVFPTLYEPFGNVHLEAMAMGLPVVTTPTAGAAEWIREGENGFVRDALDIAGFADAMRRLSDQPYARQLGAAARATVEPYTPSEMSKQLTSLYQQLLVAGSV